MAKKKGKRGVRKPKRRESQIRKATGAAQRKKKKKKY